MDAAEELIRAHTRVEAAGLVPEVRLYLAQLIVPLWQATEQLAGKASAPPFWAFAWPGSQALGRYVLDRPQLVQGRRVLDFGAGGGLAAIAAAMCGAARVVANDIDPLAAVAQRMNAELNDVTFERVGQDLVGWQTQTRVSDTQQPQVSHAQAVADGERQTRMSPERQTRMSPERQARVDGEQQAAVDGEQQAVVGDEQQAVVGDEQQAVVSDEQRAVVGDERRARASDEQQAVVDDERQTLDFDVVLAGDVCYEQAASARLTPWLRVLADAGVLVLLADPGRHYAPSDGLELLETYDVPTLHELESIDHKRTRLWRVLSAAGSTA
jgi:predicted nicotinamide N-methyase